MPKNNYIKKIRCYHCSMLMLPYEGPKREGYVIGVLKTWCSMGSPSEMLASDSSLNKMFSVWKRAGGQDQLLKWARC